MAWHLLQRRVFGYGQILAALAAAYLSGLWFYSNWLPTPGVSIAIIAVVAASMSVHPDLYGLHKAFYMLIIGGFLVLEILSINHAQVEQARKSVGGGAGQPLRQRLIPTMARRTSPVNSRHAKNARMAGPQALRPVQYGEASTRSRGCAGLSTLASPMFRTSSS